MALTCPLCRSDLVAVLAGDNIKCYQCDSTVNEKTGAVIKSGKTGITTKGDADVDA